MIGIITDSTCDIPEALVDDYGIIIGLLVVVIFSSGFRLHRSGRPFSGILLNLHKLAGLAVIVLLGMTINRVHQAQPLAGIEIAATVATFVFFAAAIVTGGLVSLAKPAPRAISRIHKVFPYVSVLLTAATLYLLQMR